MKKATTIILIISTVLSWSCNNSKQKKDKKEISTHQTIAKSDIIGEWKCIDITDGDTHMDNIAKMQARLVFKDDNSIFSKMPLPDGSEVAQKVGSYQIKDKKIVSKFFENSPFLQNGKLIIVYPDQDSKWVYEKVKK
ncbi:hypothetical protein [Lutibacter sp.]|uniref:hypothetical protein n=1 Tax=Lutibacter sp. TaxID=1925666 RepID=UPI0025C55EAA|nr:hypothetical protein [Lutibacter sp.]MCF6182302.1 hypothetical protein [Lutibacter sp.]